MKLYKHSSGTIISFGFDMLARVPHVRRICWSDTSNGKWTIHPSNNAGFMDVPFDIAPEFIHESKDGRIVAYQPGVCIEMQYVGHPYIWSFAFLKPEQTSLQAA